MARNETRRRCTVSMCSWKRIAIGLIALTLVLISVFVSSSIARTRRRRRRQQQQGASTVALSVEERLGSKSAHIAAQLTEPAGEEDGSTLPPSSFLPPSRAPFVSSPTRRLSNAPTEIDAVQDETESPSMMTPTAVPTDPIAGQQETDSPVVVVVTRPPTRPPTVPPTQQILTRAPSTIEPTIGPTESVFGQQDVKCAAFPSCGVTVGDCCPSPTFGRNLDCCDGTTKPGLLNLLLFEGINFIANLDGFTIDLNNLDPSSLVIVASTSVPELISVVRFTLAGVVPIDKPPNSNLQFVLGPLGNMQIPVLISDGTFAVKAAAFSSTGTLFNEVAASVTIIAERTPVTASPVKVPTRAPRADPTLSPKEPPSRQPTSRPTQRPPVIAPVVQPVVQPVVAPSVQPVTQPVLAPSLAPTNTPITIMPVSVPTVPPTLPPTLLPSALASLMPSFSTLPPAIVPVAGFPTPAPTSAPTQGGFQFRLVSFTVRNVQFQLRRNAGRRRLQQNNDCGLGEWSSKVQQDIQDEINVKVPGVEESAVEVENARGETLADALSLFFDVSIGIRSPLPPTEIEIGQYIAGPYDIEAERLDFAEFLRKTNCQEFRTVESISDIVVPSATPIIDEKPTSTGPDASLIGLVVGLGLAGVAIILLAGTFIYLRSRRPLQRHENEGVVPLVYTHPEQSNRNTNEYASEIGFGFNNDISTLGDPIPTGAAGVAGDQSTIGSQSLEYDYQKAFVDQNSLTDSRVVGSAEGGHSRLMTLNTPEDPALTGMFGGDVDNDTFDSNSQTEEQYEVIAPAGLLGLILESNLEDGRPMVNNVKPSSVLSNVVKIGDRLLSVDGADVTRYSANDVSHLLASKKDQESRVMVFARNLTRFSVSGGVSEME